MTRLGVLRSPAKLYRDIWVCRAADGVLHIAKVERYFNSDHQLRLMQGCTACRPVTLRCASSPGVWTGTVLPPLVIDTPANLPVIMLVAYDVSEAPTCVTCVAMGRLT